MLAGMRASAWEDLDVGLVKQIRFTEQNNLEMRAEFLNALNEVNFNFTASCTSNSLNSCQVTGDQNSPRRVQIVLRLNF
jgi:secreted Zn-dependent insulinase-like peptidase